MDGDTFSLVLLAFSVVLLLSTFLPPSRRQDASSPLEYASLPGPSLGDYVHPKGLMHALYRDSTKATRTMLELSRVYGPLFGMRLGMGRSIATTDLKDIMQVVSRSSDFVKPDGVVYTMDNAAHNSLFTLLHAEHRHKRKALQHDFHSGLLSTFHQKMGHAILEGCHVMRQAINEEVSRQQSHGLLMREGKLDFSRAMSIVTLRAITNVAFGATLSLEERQTFLDDIEILSNEMLTDVVFHPLRKLLHSIPIIGARVVRTEFTRARDCLQRQCRRLVQGRMSSAVDGEGEGEGSGDLFDAIVRLEGKENLSMIQTHVMTFALAGSLSTNHAISWSIYELCCNPKHFDTLRKEIDHVSNTLPLSSMIPCNVVQNDLKFATAVWKETLRLHPPGYGFARQAARDVVLDGSGVRVRKGEMVQALTYVVQNDEKYFEDALEFRPERWLDDKEEEEEEKEFGKKCLENGVFIPFGAGSHHCPGQFFAEHEAIFVLAEVVRRFHVTLACPPHQVVSCSGFVEIGRHSCKDDGKLDMGIPVILSERS